MRLPYLLAATLGFITCLSAFLLGLGQEDFVLPVLMFIAAAASIYVTDFRRRIQLGDWTVNVLVLLIIAFTLQDVILHIFNYQNEDLAVAIARTLVFVEMVLLFREKAPRFCWQILLISLLQVLVASAMQQGLLFGLLLIVYAFASVCAFVIILLLQESTYYRSHSFVNTFTGSLRDEITARQDHSRLVRIALLTLLTGPLSLIFSYSSDKEKKENGNKKDNFNRSGWDLLRSFFAVFPQDDTAGVGRWESVPVAEQNGNNGQNDEHNGTQSRWYEKLWDNNAPEDNLSLSGGFAQGSFDTKNARWASVPNIRAFSASQISFQALKTSPVKQRFPLLVQRPAFSAGTLQSNTQIGSKELFRHLAFGTFIAVIFSVLFFCLFPRTGKVDFYSFSFSFGQGNWNKSFQPSVSTVGFSEEVRLGSLGTVLPYHREVMTVRMVKNLSGKIPFQDNAAPQEVLYNEIEGGSVYLRGLALNQYADGIWSCRKTQPSWMTAAASPEEQFSEERSANFSAENSLLFRYFRQPAADENGLPDSLPSYRPGTIVPPETGQQLFFDDNADLISLHLKIQPLDTNIFFAPYPFFFRGGDRNIRTMPFSNGCIREARRRSRTSSITIFSAAFKSGNQLPLTPNQEWIRKKDLLQVPDSGIEKLTETAKNWDTSSNLSKEDIIGRALNLESKFLHSERFRYQLGGIMRKYGVDPLEDFISNNPAGHCEYFAGALCLMLRVNGIASRIIVGYKTPVEKLNSGTFTVRQSDAHTWVEVYVPPELVSAKHNRNQNSEWWKNGGWLRLDPTVPLPEQSLLKEVSFKFSDWNDWFKKIWNDYVIDMNPQRQTALFYEPIRDSGIWVSRRVFNLSFWKNELFDIGNYYRNLFFSGQKTVKGFKDYFLLLSPFVLLLLFAAVLLRYIKPLLRLLLFAGKNNDRQDASVEFYQDLEQILKKIAPKRKESETPLEYVSRTFTSLNLHTSISPLMDTYHRVRFRGDTLTVLEMQEIRYTLQRLKNEAAQRQK